MLEDCQPYGNSNTSNGDGIYDIKINKKRTEVKTATVGYDKEKRKSSLIS